MKGPAMAKKKGKIKEDPKEDSYPVYFDNVPITDPLPPSNDKSPNGLLFVP